ncbi:MAG: O-antigen ligase family protein [Tepidisphaeraceae bacterium]|jgi:O-antigen ligase
MPVVPGTASPPRGPGPAVGIALDLLLWLPVLLVFLRRLLDREYRVRLPLSFLPLVLLCVWALISIAWAADKFAVLVNAFHLIGAAGAMFAAVQLVRGWRQVRLVAGVAMGVMLMLLANGVNKRVFDAPEIIREWNDRSSPNSRWHYMQEHGLHETDFQFQQIEKKIAGGELTGFSASANTYGAMIAVGLVVLFGIMAQGLSDSRKWWWATAVVALPAAVFVLRYTHSRQAAMTPLLGLSALLLVRWKGSWLAARATTVYWLGAGAFALGAVALVGHAMYHGSLGDRSLTFRWYYWVGAARIVAQRPFTGVGWANFGEYYSSVRVAQATEEVQDPHNILVRAFAELGIVGGALLVAWLMRLFWEMTRPTAPADTSIEGHRRNARATKENAAPVKWAIGLAIAAAALNLLAGHDFSQNAAWLELQAIYSLGAAVLLAAAIFMATTSGRSTLWDDAPGDWILRGLVAAAGIFFIHNLIDFSWSEPAPFSLFSLLAGAAVGARQRPAAAAMPVSAVAGTAGGATVLWLAALLCVWRPVYIAEDRAAEADARVRAAWSNGEVNRFVIGAAADDYAAAFDMMPLNADYLLRGAQMQALRGDRARAAGACDQAIRVNPRQATYHILRAEIELTGDKPDPAIVKRAMESAITLDPRQVSLHIRYGDALLRLGDKAAAQCEYARALALDDELPEKEPKRLPTARRLELERKARGE